MDNPHIDKSIKDYIEALPENVCLIYNDVNIGLAMSMNKAAAAAKGKYIARMDADDISVRERLEIQFHEMEKYGYDLTCGKQNEIDENGEKLNWKHREMNDSILIGDLPYENTIIHPTVMMKKSVFDNAGGYRNFPCAQDYDMWLRFYSMNINMHYIDRTLLFYRIRSNAISISNAVCQAYTAQYIKKLYRERKKTGKDSFSAENYNNYLKKHKVFDSDFCKKADDGKKLKSLITEYKADKRTKPKAYALMLKLFLTNEYYRKHYIKRILAVLKIK